MNNWSVPNTKDIVEYNILPSTAKSNPLPPRNVHRENKTEASDSTYNLYHNQLQSDTLSVPLWDITSVNPSYI